MGNCGCECGACRRARGRHRWHRDVAARRAVLRVERHHGQMAARHTYAVGQLMLVRSISGLCVMAPAIHRVGLTGFRDAPRPGLQLVRAGFSTLEASLFFWALSTLPLAEVMTYYMAGPIYVTALSPCCWASALAGVAGPPSGWVSAGSPSLSTRRRGRYPWGGVRPRRQLFLRAVPHQPPASSPLCPAPSDDEPARVLPDFRGGSGAGLRVDRTGPTDFALMLLLGVGSLLGNLCVNQSLRLAPATTVVPYQYTLILWGMLFGYVFFGEMISPAHNGWRRHHRCQRSLHLPAGAAVGEEIEGP